MRLLFERDHRWAWPPPLLEFEAVTMRVFFAALSPIAISEILHLSK